MSAERTRHASRNKSEQEGGRRIPVARPRQRAAAGTVAVMRHGFLAIVLLTVAACGPSTATPTTSSTEAELEDTSTTTTAASSSTSSTTPGPAIDPPPGYAVFGSEDRGFVVSLPDSFIEADLTPGQVADNIEELAPANAAAVRSAVEQQGDSLLFVAIDSHDTADEFLSNVNILVIPAAGTTPGAIVESLTSTYRDAGGTLLESEVYDVGPTQFVAVTAQQPQPLPDGGELLQTVYQLFAISPEAIINITLSTDSPFDYDEAFQVMIATLRLGIIPGFST